MEYGSARFYRGIRGLDSGRGYNGIRLGMEGVPGGGSEADERGCTGTERPYKPARRKVFGSEIMAKIMRQIWFCINPNARDIHELKHRMDRLENTVLKDAVRKMADNK